MKTVFSNDMVAHVWAQQNQSEGRSHNGNFWFRDSTIYSYGQHFPIARFITHEGRRAVLFTTDSYGITTSRHCSRTRQAIPEGVPVFKTARVGELDHMRQKAEYESRLEAAVLAVSRARINTSASWRMQIAEEIVAEANTYAEFFGLDWRIEAPQWSPEFIASAKKKAAEASAAKAEATRKAREAREKEAAEKLAAWLAGASDYAPRGIGEVYMRVAGDEVQTSMGARFPVDHAKRAFAVIKACREKGEGWQRNGHTIHLGAFAIDRIEPNGDVRAGCHFVKWPQIEKVAAELGL